MADKINNPIPDPVLKPHKEMDFDIKDADETAGELKQDEFPVVITPEDDYDIKISEDDDFDIY